MVVADSRSAIRLSADNRARREARIGTPRREPCGLTRGKGLTVRMALYGVCQCHVLRRGDTVALLRYAAADVLRSRRRTLTAILGVLLAVTFIAGTFIAIDSSTRATLDGILATYPADIQFQAGPGNATQIREALEAIPGIVRVASWRNAQFSEMESPSSGGPTYAQVVGVEPDRPPSFLNGITTTAGNLSLPRGTVALSEDLAKQVNVSLGGTAAFVYRTYNITGNETLTRVDVTVGGLFRNPYTGVGPFYAPATALVQIRDVDWYEQQLSVIPYGGNFIAGEIRIDRDRLLDPYDLAASRSEER